MSPNEPHGDNEPGAAAGGEGPEQRPSGPGAPGEHEQAGRFSEAGETGRAHRGGPDDDGRPSLEDELFGEAPAGGAAETPGAPGHEHGAGAAGAPPAPGHEHGAGATGDPAAPAKGSIPGAQEVPAAPASDGATGAAPPPAGPPVGGPPPEGPPVDGPPATPGPPEKGPAMAGPDEPSAWQQPTGPAGRPPEGAGGWRAPSGQGDTGAFSRPEGAYAAYGTRVPSGHAPPYPGHGGPDDTASFAAGGYGGPGQPPGGGPYHGPEGHPQGPVPPREPPRRTGRVVAVSAITALVTSIVVGSAFALGAGFLFPNGLGGPVSSLSGEGGSTATEGEVGDVAEQILPSVVSIQAGAGGGSGVIISSDGQILTNAHVVQAAAEEGELEVAFNDGTGAPAEVLGADPVSDIAVIQAEGQSGLTPAQLGDSDQVGVGGEVVAIGSPLGLSGTVTTGIVSALDRPVNTGASEGDEGQTSTVINAIQTDAAINPGNSGGPLVNMAGEVVGINTAIAGVSQESGSVGLGFAIPINQVQPIAEQLIEEGSASYPAIEATVAGHPGGGAQIVEANEGGAADEAGLESGDVLTSVDGRSVNSPDQLIAEIRSRQPGDEITLGVLRDGSGDEEEVEVTLGEQSAASVEEESEQEGEQEQEEGD